MRLIEAFEFPGELAPKMKRARRLEYVTIGYLASAIFLMWLVLGQSQAMRTAWFEDILSLFPPIVFLIANRYSLRPASEEFPYGHHRAASAAYLGASLALFFMGGFLLFEAAMELIQGRHPTIGTIDLFGWSVWLGWPMIAALLYSAVPAVILGRMKLPLSTALYDKVLFADAQMNKADWLTAVAAIVGVLGIGFGLWWADAVAAAFISLDILRDGFVNLRTSLADLMDQRPWKPDHSAPDPIVDEVAEYLRAQDWIEEADVRIRVNGHTLFGEAYVVPARVDGLAERIEGAIRHVKSMDWRLHSLTITPVMRLSRRTEGR